MCDMKNILTSLAFLILCTTGVAALAIDDDDASIIYSRNNWGGAGFKNGSFDYQQTERYSNFCFSSSFPVKGAKATINFTGTGITWVGKKGPNYGIASYSIDGGTPISFDAYSPNEVFQSNNAVITGLPDGPHALTIEVTCNKNAASSNYYQVIDQFLISGTPLSPSQGTLAGYNSSALSFGGAWTCAFEPDGSDLSGGHCYINAANASISWKFTGSMIEMFGRPDLEDAIFNVLIDGAQIATVDGHFGNVDNDALNAYPLFIAQVTPGTHTIQLVNTGKKDSAASNSYLQFDQFMAFGGGRR
jgi:hypothetical protein